MNILYSKRFSKDIDSIKDNRDIKKHLLQIINRIKEADSFNEINNIKKIKGYSEYYRIKISDYRLGVKKDKNNIELIRFLHRKDIYRRFS